MTHATTPTPAEVWVFDFTAEGPEGGDYDGHQSVHVNKLSALQRLISKLAEFGIFFDDLSNEEGLMIVAHNRADNGSETVDLHTDDGVEISYGIHRMPVEAEAR